MTTENDTATFKLEEDGGNLVWSSVGEQSLTFGYASLDCAEPVTAQVLYSSSVASELVSLTSMPGAQKADRFQFTLMPQVGSLVLVFANDLEPDASCELELESPYGSVLSQASISIPAMTSVFQMADELFRIPDDYTAGAVRVICDRELAATGFLLNGGKFSVLPPVALPMPMISILGGGAVTEGGDTVFTITANASSVKDLTLSLTVSDIGNHVDSGDLGEKRVTLPAGRTSVDYIVATTDDSDNEDDGAVTVTVNPAEGYQVSEIDDSMQVVIRDNDKPALVTEPVEPEPEPEPEPELEPIPQPDPAPNPTHDPQSTLTGFSLSSRSSGRFHIVDWNTEPEDTELSNLSLDWEPSNAGRIWDSSFYYEQFIFRCDSDYVGNVTIRVSTESNDVEFEATVSFYCG